MKIIQKLILSLLIMSCATSLNAQQQNEISIIEPKYSEITEIISTIYQKFESVIGFDDNMVFGLNTYKEKDIYLIEITIFYQEDLGMLLRDYIKKESFGFFNYENIPVLVFGESANEFFTRTDSSHFFEWFKVLPPEENTEVIIIAAYEPPAWTYEFYDNTFNFKGTDYWSPSKW